MQYILKYEPHDVTSNIDIECLRLANTLQLKIIILILKKVLSKLDSVFISDVLKESVKKVEEAILFWVKNGLCEAVINSEVRYHDKTENFVNFESLHNKNQKLNNCEFLKEIEKILARPLSWSDVSVFLNLRDKEGLDESVIIMLANYCSRTKKTNARYVYKVGLDWSRNGIDDILKVDKKMKEMEEFGIFWKRYEKITGIESRMPTTKERDMIGLWFKTWNYSDDIIRKAYEICVDSKGKYIVNYVDKIIKNWHSEGIRKIEDIGKINNKRRFIVENFKKTSYNIKDYEKN